MHKTWVLVSVLGGLALAGRASAAPSLFGPTGLLIIPTADTLAQQSWNAHAHAVDTGPTLTTFGLNYGVAKQFEVGVTGFHVSGIGTKALFNVKYAFLMETAKVTGLAVGGFDLASQIPGSDPGVYVVASKSLSSLLGGQLSKYNLRGHLGYGANNIFNDDVFGGLDLQVTPKIQAMVEWLNGNFYFGGRVGVGAGLRAELGSYDGEIGGGISYAAALK